MIFLIVYSRIGRALRSDLSRFKPGNAKEIKNATLGGIFDFWQGHLCNSRTDEIHNLLQFGKEIKLFLQNL